MRKTLTPHWFSVPWRRAAQVLLLGMLCCGFAHISFAKSRHAKVTQHKKEAAKKSRAADTPKSATQSPKSVSMDQSALEKALDDVLQDKALRRSTLGLYVVRLNDGAELFSHQADKLLVPASTVKIVTTAAALHTFGADYQFPTEIYGAMEPDGTVEGDLYLKGYGDPFMVPERVWYLANQIYLRGVKEIDGDLIVDDSYFAGSLMANGMEQDGSSASYMAPAGATSVSFNTIRVHVIAGASKGSDARIRIEPASDYIRVDSDVTTVVDRPTQISITASNDTRDHTRLTIKGQICINDEPYRAWRRIDHPAIFAGELLKRHLSQVGVRVKGDVRTGLVDDSTPKLVTIYSPNLWELISHLNKNSNNFMAAQVAYALGAHVYGAPGSWEKAQHALEAFLEEEVGIAHGTYQLGNASGLHDVNRLSAKQIVRVLQYMYGHNAAGPEFLTSLAVAGGSGTLQNRMNDSEAAFRLRGKTGTLSIASALSGYVTTVNGDMLAFTMIANNYKTGLADVWRAQDRIGTILTNLGSSVPGGRLPPKKNQPIRINKYPMASKQLIQSSSANTRPAAARSLTRSASNPSTTVASPAPITTTTP